MLPAFRGPFTTSRTNSAGRDKVSGVLCSIEIQTKQHGRKSAYLLKSDISVITGSREESARGKMLHSADKE